MSKNAIIGTVVAIVIIGLGFWFYSSHGASVGSNANLYGNTGATSDNGTPSNNSTSGNTSVSANDSSDAAISQDLGNVDTQMSGLSSDNASADQGINNPNQ